MVTNVQVLMNPAQHERNSTQRAGFHGTCAPTNVGVKYIDLSLNREEGRDSIGRQRLKKEGGLTGQKVVPQGSGIASAMQIRDFRDRIENSNCNVSLFHPRIFRLACH